MNTQNHFTITITLPQSPCDSPYAASQSAYFCYNKNNQNTNSFTTIFPFPLGLSSSFILKYDIFRSFGFYGSTKSVSKQMTLNITLLFQTLLARLSSIRLTRCEASANQQRLSVLPLVPVRAFPCLMEYSHGLLFLWNLVCGLLVASTAVAYTVFHQFIPWTPCGC